MLTNENDHGQGHDNDNNQKHDADHNQYQPKHTTVYGINGLGERIYKAAADRDQHDWDDFLRVFGLGSVEYVYDNAGHLIGEYAQGRAIHETVYLGDLPVAVLDGTNCFGEGRTATNVHYINSDTLGAPHIITDERNRKVWQWEHAPFGDTKPIEAAGFTDDLRFPGQVHDAASGLNNNLFRDYNSKLGRYVQSDPIGLAGGVNTYGYVGQNPISRFDQSGRFIGPAVRFVGAVGACALNPVCRATALALIDEVLAEISLENQAAFVNVPLVIALTDENNQSVQIAVGFGYSYLQEAADVPKFLLPDFGNPAANAAGMLLEQQVQQMEGQAFQFPDQNPNGTCTPANPNGAKNNA